MWEFEFHSQMKQTLLKLLLELLQSFRMTAKLLCWAAGVDYQKIYHGQLFISDDYNTHWQLLRVIKILVHGGTQFLVWKPGLSWIPCKLVNLSHFISWKTHFLITAGSGFCQIWLGRNTNLHDGITSLHGIYAMCLLKMVQDPWLGRLQLQCLMVNSCLMYFLCLMNTFWFSRLQFFRWLTSI